MLWNLKVNDKDVHPNWKRALFLYSPSMKDKNNYNKVYSVIRQSEGYLTHIRGTKLDIQVQVNPQFGPNGDKNSDLMI